MASALFSGLRYSDSLTVIGISFCTAIVCEAISWLLIYRTTSYKSLKSSIDKASKKLETMKTDGNSSSAAIIKKTSKTKKIDRVESSLKESSRDLLIFKFKSGGVVALVLFMVFGLLNSLFDGKPVAKIPFVPITLEQKMSHRRLSGEDMTDCSMAFLYFLCSISIRTNLQKVFGFRRCVELPVPDCSLCLILSPVEWKSDQFWQGQLLTRASRLGEASPKIKERKGFVFFSFLITH